MLQLSVLVPASSHDVSLTFNTPDAIAIVGTVVAVAVAAAVGWAHHRQLERSRRRLELVKEQMLAALNLHGILVEDKELEQAVHEISSQYARVTEQSDLLMMRLVQRDLDKATHYISMGADGHVTFGADAFSHTEFLASALLDITEEGDEFWASSFVRTDFWSFATGYLRKQEEKLQRNEITIKRVFGFGAEADAKEQRIRDQMLRQQQAKVDVRILVEQTLAPRDLVVVLKPDQNELLVPKYAMVCRIGTDRLIDHIDLWVAQGVKSEMVEKTWGELHELFQKGAVLPPSQ